MPDVETRAGSWKLPARFADFPIGKSHIKRSHNKNFQPKKILFSRTFKTQLKSFSMFYIKIGKTGSQNQAM